MENLGGPAQGVVLPVRARLLKALVLCASSFVALAAALALGRDDWLGVLVSFGWDTLLVGGLITVWGLAMTVISRVRKEPQGEPWAAGWLLAQVRSSLRWTLVGGLIYVFVYLTGGPTMVAGLAGFVPGLFLGFWLLHLMLRGGSPF